MDVSPKDQHFPLFRFTRPNKNGYMGLVDGRNGDLGFNSLSVY